MFKLSTGYCISTHCNQNKSGRIDCARNGKSARRKDNNTHWRSAVSGDRRSSFTNCRSCWEAHRNWGSFQRWKKKHEKINNKNLVWAKLLYDNRTSFIHNIFACFFFLLYIAYGVHQKTNFELLFELCVKSFWLVWFGFGLVCIWFFHILLIDFIDTHTHTKRFVHNNFVKFNSLTQNALPIR